MTSERVQVEIDAPAFGRAGTVIRYGHWGRPVVVFPSEAGRAWDYESNGMVDAVADLIEAGRIKLYCIDSFDASSWSDGWLPLEERAARHKEFEAWVTGPVWSWISEDSGGAAGEAGAIATGCSMGAYHALQLCLTRADLFPVAICQSGNYDPTTFRGWGDSGDAAYFTNPTHYVPHLEGEHLDWLRSRVQAVLVVGEGPWEVHPTSSLPSARRMAGLLADRGIPHELDVWGPDSAHDWPWWRRQIAHHLPRFC
ncbi:MAG: alpha/beta hydrolase-fold protein [Nocardioides sp.]